MILFLLTSSRIDSIRASQHLVEYKIVLLLEVKKHVTDQRPSNKVLQLANIFCGLTFSTVDSLLHDTYQQSAKRQQSITRWIHNFLFHKEVSVLFFAAGYGGVAMESIPMMKGIHSRDKGKSYPASGRLNDFRLKCSIYE